MMTIEINGIRENLINAINGFQKAFNGFDFKTSSGLSVANLNGIDGFSLLAIDGECIEDFEGIRNTIESSLTANFGNNKKFDWDYAENKYDEIVEEYISYQTTLTMIEENISGEQTLENIELITASELSAILIDYAIQENLVHQVVVGDEIQYLINSNFKKML